MTSTSSECERARDGDAVVRYLSDAMEPRERDAFEAHYFECDACWRRLRLAVDVRSALSETEEGRPGKATPALADEDAGSWLGRRWPAVAAAAAAALVVVAVTTLDVFRERASVGPSPGETAPEAGAFRGEGTADWRATATREDESLAASWPAVERADVYRVRLFGSAGGLLLEREVADTTVVVDLGTVATGEAESPLHLEVVALDALRETLESTGLQPVEPPPGSI